MRKDKHEHHYWETASADRYGLLKEFAHENKEQMTKCEHILWDYLRGNRYKIRFRRQHPIGDYIVDFVCLSANLVIEVDGGYHSDPLQQCDDELRTQYLNSIGFNVMRFKNEQILNDIDAVVAQIFDYVLEFE